MLKNNSIKPHRSSDKDFFAFRMEGQVEVNVKGDGETFGF